MHELALAQSLVEILCEEARHHGLARVERFTVRVGTLRAVVPELFHTGVEFACKGTVAEGAKLDLQLVPGKARCPDCSLEFEVEELLFLCPRCERLGGELLAGQELTLVELEGD